MNTVRKPRDKEKMNRDRRLDCRYPIQLVLKYEIYNAGEGIRERGIAVTTNISRGGICFEGKALSVGTRVGLAIAWPIILEDGCNLVLVTLGRVVRSVGITTAIRAKRYEFRNAKAILEGVPIRSLVSK